MPRYRLKSMADERQTGDVDVTSPAEPSSAESCLIFGAFLHCMKIPGSVPRKSIRRTKILGNIFSKFGHRASAQPVSPLIALPYELRLMIFKMLGSHTEVKALASTHSLLDVVYRDNDRIIWAAVGSNVARKLTKDRLGYESVEVGALCLAVMEYQRLDTKLSVFEHNAEISRICEVYHTGAFTGQDVGLLESDGLGVLRMFNRAVSLVDHTKETLKEESPSDIMSWRRPVSVDDLKLCMTLVLHSANLSSWEVTESLGSYATGPLLEAETLLETEPLLAPYNDAVKAEIRDHAVRMRSDPGVMDELAEANPLAPRNDGRSPGYRPGVYFPVHFDSLRRDRELHSVFAAQWLSLGEWTDSPYKGRIRCWPSPSPTFGQDDVARWPHGHQDEDKAIQSRWAYRHSAAAVR
ncbi:hypothetical protein F5Y18DRAFT_429770 [Xylariaceae sp. FL1019]|nr:hypothetical protein F5Y18DRAFT_429770 [Xylariaceae sp. FL1019]